MCHYLSHRILSPAPGQVAMSPLAKVSNPSPQGRCSSHCQWHENTTFSPRPLLYICFQGHRHCLCEFPSSVGRWRKRPQVVWLLPAPWVGDRVGSKSQIERIYHFSCPKQCSPQMLTSLSLNKFPILTLAETNRYYSGTGFRNLLQPCSRAARKWRENEEME